MYKVRFNLGKGPRYKKWKITDHDGVSTYHDPKEVQLILHNCVLKNNKSAANKIFNGANKTVCAWVLAKDVEIVNYTRDTDNLEKVSYNPRVKPHWTYLGKDVDMQEFKTLISNDNQLCIES